VLRRGPTEWFHVARWDLARDTVEHGAWLRATIYPTRCALSPDGAFLAAFIRDERRGAGEWYRYFAVSKVPWLRSLAAWNTVNTYTTGSHFEADGTLLLAGTVISTIPFHGSYPGRVVVEPTDLQWTRAALFRELRTGWLIADPNEAWMEALPAPLAASPGSLVITRTAPHGGKQRLALVSLFPGQREYYIIDQGAATPLLDALWAEWHPQRIGTLAVTTSLGTLRLLTMSLDITWEYDMNPFEPDPQEAPRWAASW
jgi:hypothetical protein